MSAIPNILIFCFHPTSHQTPKGIILSHCLKCLNSFFIILTTAKFCTAFPWQVYLSLKTFFFISWRTPLAGAYCSGLILVSLWGWNLISVLSLTPKTPVPACTDQAWVTKEALLFAHNEAIIRLCLDFQGSSTDPSAVLCQWLSSISCGTICLLFRLSDLALHCFWTWYFDYFFFPSPK